MMSVCLHINITENCVIEDNIDKSPIQYLIMKFVHYHLSSPADDIAGPLKHDPIERQALRCKPHHPVILYT